MLQHKVLQLLGRLNSDEFKGFSRFLQSTFFNSNARIITFYNQIKKYYPDFDSPKLTREKLYAKIFPKKKYHYQQFANLLSEFTRLTEEYFIQLELRANDFQRRQQLAASYNKRDLFDLFEKESLNLVAQISEKEATESDLALGYLLLKKYYFHTFQNKHTTDSSLLKQLMRFLDDFYLEEKLVLASEIKNKATILNTQIDIPLLEPIKHILKDKKSNYRLYTYFLLLNLIDTEGKEDYLILKQYFLENQLQIQGDLKLITFKYLRNFCTKQLNYGDYQKYGQDLFDLNQFGLESKLFVRGNSIISSDFISIVLIAIFIDSNNKDWVLDFIKTYQSFLKPEIKSETLILVNACLSFSEQAYDKVLADLINYKALNPTSTLTAKKLLIRSYFENYLLDSSYYDLLESTCLSFEKNLYRDHTNMSNRIKANLNFSTILRKIAKTILIGQFNSQSKSQFIQAIKEKEYLVLKHWLLKRLSELPPKFSTKYSS